MYIPLKMAVIKFTCTKRNCKTNHEHYDSDQAVLVEIFKPLISRIRSRSLKNYIAILYETREDEIC